MRFFNKILAKADLALIKRSRITHSEKMAKQALPLGKKLWHAETLTSCLSEQLQVETSKSEQLEEKLRHAETLTSRLSGQLQVETSKSEQLEEKLGHAETLTSRLSEQLQVETSKYKQLTEQLLMEIKNAELLQAKLYEEAKLTAELKEKLNIETQSLAQSRICLEKEREKMAQLENITEQLNHIGRKSENIHAAQNNVLHALESTQKESRLFGFTKHRLEHIEMHITHKCMLKCSHCTHYCNLQYDDPISYDIASQWLKSWSQRLFPERFRILGGEPLLEKDLIKYIYGVAEAFPNARRDVVTNGILLQQWAETLPSALKETNTALTISVHPLKPRFRTPFKQALGLVEDWKKQYEISVNIDDAIAGSRWRSCYQGEKEEILPFMDKNPWQSRQTCFAKNCTIIHQGSLWQCAQLAFLPLIKDKLTNKEAWEPFLQYAPIQFSVSDTELAAFCKGMHSVPYCAMCPESPVFVKPKAGG